MLQSTRGALSVAAMLAAAGFWTAAVPAAAGGFALKEGSTSAQGASFAGATSAATDISYSFWNPAAIGQVANIEVAGSISYIAPDSDGVVRSSGAQVSGAESAVVPASYAAIRVHDRIVLGVGVGSPFGLATEYDPGELAPLNNPRRTALTLIEISPMIAVNLTPTFTLAGGPTIVTGHLVFESALPGANIELDVAGTSYGWQVGAHWTPLPGTQVGAAFQSGYNLSARGGRAEIATAAGVNTFHDARFGADLPPLATFGVTQAITDDFRVMAEAQWQGWSSLDRAQFSSLGLLAVTGSQSGGEDFNYDDALLFALGAEADANDWVTLRTGVAWDQTPTVDADRTARIPDADRLWLSVGGSLRVLDNATIDVAYSLLHAIEDVDANISTIAPPGDSVEFEGTVHIFSIGGSVEF